MPAGVGHPLVLAIVPGALDAPPPRLPWRWPYLLAQILPADATILRSVEGTTAWVPTPKIIPAGIAEIIVP